MAYGPVILTPWLKLKPSDPAELSQIYTSSSLVTKQIFEHFRTKGPCSYNIWALSFHNMGPVGYRSLPKRLYSPSELSYVSHLKTHILKLSLQP